MMIHVGYDWRIRVSMHQFVINWDLFAFLRPISRLIYFPLERIFCDLSHALTYDLGINSLRILGFDVSFAIVLVLTSLNPLIYWSPSVLVNALLYRVEIYRIFLIVEFIELDLKAVSRYRSIKRYKIW